MTRSTHGSTHASTRSSPFALAALALPLALSLAACGGFSRGTPEERALARAESLLDDVDATEDQRVQVRAAVSDLTKTFAAQRAARAGTKDLVLAQLAAERADADALVAQADLATASLATNAHAVVDAGLAIHAALTPEQRAILTAKAKPGRFMRAGFFVAGRMGYGPPADAEEAQERAAARLEEALDGIDATEAQREALRPIAASLVADAAPLLEDKDAIVEAFTGAWKSERPDGAALHALVDAELAKVSAVARKAAVSAAEAHAVLTPEQRATLAARAKSGGCRHHDDGPAALPAADGTL